MDRLILFLLLTNSMLEHLAIVNAEKTLCDKEVEGNGVVHISVSSNTNCAPTYSCKELGGFCFTSGSKCNGKIDAYGCTGVGMRCMCCIPDDSCPGICPHHVSPICAVMNNESKRETFSNEECFKEKVKCDPAFANYTFKHEGQCDDPITTDSTTKPSTTLYSTTKVPTTVAPTTTEYTTKGTVCSHPWFIVGDQCFRVIGGTSDDESEARTWTAARTHCQSLTPVADLATPNNVEALADAVMDNGYMGDLRYWLGGSDAAFEGLWRWLDGRTIPVGPGHNWWPGQPDGAGGVDDEDYLYIHPDKHLLADGRVGWTLPFICEA